MENILEMIYPEKISPEVINSTYRGQVTNGKKKKLRLSGFKTIGSENMYKPHTQPLENNLLFSSLHGALQKLATYQAIRQICTISNTLCHRDHRKKPRSPFLVDWIKNLWCIYTSKCYPTVKMNQPQLSSPSNTEESPKHNAERKNHDTKDLWAVWLQSYKV